MFLLDEVIRPDIIHPRHMVFVLVGKNDRIQFFNLMREHLLPEIRSGVDDE
ncbi:hypothetical protein D3C83_234800 [compost metagenome]